MTPPSAASLPQRLRDLAEESSKIETAWSAVARDALRSAAEALEHEQQKLKQLAADYAENARLGHEWKEKAERAEEVVIAAGAWCVAERGSEEEAAAEERILVTVAAYYEWKHASRVRQPQPKAKEPE